MEVQSFLPPAAVLPSTIQETNDDRYTTHHTISTEAVIDDDDGGGGECFPIFAFWLMLDWGLDLMRADHNTKIYPLQQHQQHHHHRSHLLVMIWERDRDTRIVKDYKKNYNFTLWGSTIPATSSSFHPSIQQRQCGGFPVHTFYSKQTKRLVYRARYSACLPVVPPRPWVGYF